MKKISQVKTKILTLKVSISIFYKPSNCLPHTLFTYFPIRKNMTLLLLSSWRTIRTIYRFSAWCILYRIFFFFFTFSIKRFCMSSPAVPFAAHSRPSTHLLQNINSVRYKKGRYTVQVIPLFIPMCRISFVQFAIENKINDNVNIKINDNVDIRE